MEQAAGAGCRGRAAPAPHELVGRFVRFGGHMSLFFTFLFLFIYDTLQNMVRTVGSHNTILYDEAGDCEWNCWYYTNHIT